MSTKGVVAIAMSGGVDSSVAAALLVEQGYTVIGMMLNLWNDPDTERQNRCCSPDAVAAARRVATLLSIPFYVLDAREIFYEQVIKPFIYDYTHNRTPNPCVACNRFVRWGFLLNQALSAGADYLATGHYARLQDSPDGMLQLLRGSDHSKDQSYVLHSLSQVHLRHTLFPLGELTKPQVRLLARRFSLPVAEKPDSQDLCFVGVGGDYRQFLARHVHEALIPGEILNHQGALLGHHRGLPLYTLGQRKGLRIANPTPLYVIEKNYQANKLIVGPAHLLAGHGLIAKNVNWIAGTAPPAPFQATIKIRYQAPAAPCTISPQDGNAFQAEFDYPVMDITPGQAAVLYNGNTCLGGGTIADKLDN